MEQQAAPTILLNVMDHIQVSELEDSMLQSLITPSPRSEMVAHEFQELTLQTNPHLPPLNERKNVLQLKLQQRRTREQLVDQGIMPPLKSPAAFHEQRKSLERARTEDYLKHKIRSRPERSELVRMHILEETLAEPSLQATQMKLKRARLADDLNEKIAQRPGPMELVEKNILPVDSSLKEAIKVGQVHYPKTLDTFSFDDDSSDALSPEQPGSQESQSSAPSPGETKVTESSSSSSSSPVPNTIIQYHPQPMPDFLKPAPLPDQQGIRSISTTMTTSTVVSTKPAPTLIKQSQPKTANDKNRSKKNKDLKPRVKQLKYHQYIPPDKKHEKIELPMDTNYSRLLQQQQLFLQLQILSQQQQHYNYPAILPAPPKYVAHTRSCNDNQPTSSITTSTTLANCAPALSSHVTLHNSTPCWKLGTLPSNLDDMKVAELKLELKLRGLPVSGTKMDLIERLKSYQDLSNAAVSAAVVTASNSTIARNQLTAAFPIAALSNVMTTTEATVTTASNNFQFYENAASPSPTSPAPSEQSNISTDDSNLTDMFTELVTMVSPSQLTIHASPVNATVNEDSTGVNGATNHSNSQGASLASLDADATEKDRKLQEKERQIIDLKRKLEQEQKLVEELKIQLEIEKRCQHQQSVTVNQQQLETPVKEEHSLSNCPISRQPATAPNQPLGPSTITNLGTCSQNAMKQNGLLVKQEGSVATAGQQNAVSQFYVNPARQTPTTVIAQAQPHALLTTQTGTQLLLPLAIQAQNANPSSESKHLHAGNIKLQSHSQAQVQIPIAVPTSAPVQSSGSQKQPQPSEPVPQHSLSQNPQITKVFASTSTTNIFTNHIQTAATVQQCFINNSTGNVHHPRISSVNASLNGPNCVHKSRPSSPPQSQQQLVIQHQVFSNSVSKAKELPRYEEAVKQTRNLKQQEVFNAHSQQMDDLFDILIESGEISPIVKEESLPATKMRAVVANISSLPVNAALSRPPPQVQMAPPPLSLESANDLTVGSENQLEAFLDGTLSSGADIPQMAMSQEGSDSLPVMEDLQNDLLNTPSILDQHHSAMDTCDMHFNAENSCLNLDLPDTNLDNMDWLDLTMPASTTGLTPISSAAHSVFSTDFLDGHDLQLHWE
ncbi:myocardin-related transcription factor B isoform X1 [Hemiscyllium ocellatum]|uniref:myocardin-related transcription factor B isoform X1 n=1 Tax=Hemiscyllium ocellatum TaxID=170820 RepID=UPI00296689FC|nr:myocardin-related transcription factor B isoform X1 [Hemiscyllium ocellatum]XP_060696430.1 myocardin-related transcription factor B isoform X1 [Hemiscyllium ocellatum]XP_060696431.1 myocardin-related transcription factor B isoform X1 [Hemiscyllium ocellatum]